MCHKQAGNRSVPKCARAKKQTASELQHEQSGRWLESLKNSRPTLRCTADSADMLANLSIQPLSKATRTLATGDNNHISTYIKNHQDTATDLRLKTTRADWINSRTTGHTWITWRHWPSRAGGQTEASLLERLARKSTVIETVRLVANGGGHLAWYWELIFAKLHTRSLRTLAPEHKQNLRPQQCQTSCSPASARLHPPNKEWWLDKHFHVSFCGAQNKRLGVLAHGVANKVDTCLLQRLPSDLVWNPQSVSCFTLCLVHPQINYEVIVPCKWLQVVEVPWIQKGEVRLRPRTNWQSKYSSTTLLFTFSLMQKARDHSGGVILKFNVKFIRYHSTFCNALANLQYILEQVVFYEWLWNGHSWFPSAYEPLPMIVTKTIWQATFWQISSPLSSWQLTCRQTRFKSVSGSGACKCQFWPSPSRSGELQ